MIKSGYDCFKFDVKFSHPDDSPLITSVTYIVENDEERNMLPKKFMKLVCSAIWDKYNSSGYYHEMLISQPYVIDNEAVYTTYTRYDGYDVELLPTTIQKIVEG